MSNLKAGDVVRMKSGGPKMTIVRIWEQYGTVGADGPKAYCQWFTNNGLLESQSFAIDTLEVV